MKSLSKPNVLICAFHLLAHNKIGVADGIKIGDKLITCLVDLPKTFDKGADYAITENGGRLRAIGAPASAVSPLAGAVGGFHVGLDGNVVEASIWDAKFRPAAPDPRGMVLVAELFWSDIYLTGVNALTEGTSRARAIIADGSSLPWIAPGIRAERFNFWVARDLLAAHGKQLLSAPEFALAAEGVTENKTAGRDPKKTGHIKGLRSRVGLEQATGVMWTWSRDILPYGWNRLMGGSWRSDDAGSRRLGNGSASYSGGDVGARGRCDHLILA